MPMLSLLSHLGSVCRHHHRLQPCLLVRVLKWTPAVDVDIRGLATEQSFPNFVPEVLVHKKQQQCRDHAKIDLRLIELKAYLPHTSILE